MYVPTTPNPTSGLIVYVPASQVVESDMTVDAAMKMVVTMGIVMPPPRRPRTTCGRHLNRRQAGAGPSILRTLFPVRMPEQVPMRSHYCGQVNEQLAGQEVTVAGWVHRRRDHGGVIFVDLRDREGLLQIVFDPDNQALFAEAERLRGEFVIQVRGLVRARPAGTANANLASGKVELLARAADGAQPLRAAAVPARRTRQRGSAPASIATSTCAARK